MKKFITVAGAAGLGAVLMYLFDPDRGKRRRALLRNKAEHASRVAIDAAGKTKRDVQNHVQGFLAEVDSLVAAGNVTDEVLEARVRSKMGRIVSHPHAVRVTANEGTVTLRGPILSDEIHRLLTVITGMRGVTNIDNRLEIHESRTETPALQGGRRRRAERFGPFKLNWSPTMRLVTGATGGALVLYGARRRGAVGPGLSLMGGALATRALTNLSVRKLIGIDGDAAEFSVEKAMTIDASIDEVFTFCSHPENFPKVMRHVREVRKIGEGLYRWTIGGPALSIDWDAQVTDFEFNQLYAWKSLPGAMIHQHGVTRFQANPDGRTRVEVKLSYGPPAGATGPAIDELFGIDPKRELLDDLMRMKSLLETRIPAPAVAPQGAQVQAASLS